MSDTLRSLLVAAAVWCAAPGPSTSEDRLPRVAQLGTAPPAWTVPRDYAWIPGGTFAMGTEAGEDARWVTLSPYAIGRTEVSLAEYRRCVRAGRCDAPVDPLRRFGVTDGDLPVAGVTHAMAAAYCTFAGGRLPTEAEWEFAARGTDGRRFPWGPRPPQCRFARFAGCGDGPRSVLAPDAAESPFGVRDLSGNVAEWTNDIYGTLAAGAQRDPRGPEEGDTRVVRGGSFRTTAGALRAWQRDQRRPDEASYDLGFRCVRTR